ncbi:MAG: IS21 family transposase [Chloroflexota bacterium]|nr:IS21 family transposase [Chloroflexota bacterium]
MRKARELLRLCLDKGHSGRQAAKSAGISASTASVYLRRAREAQLDWATVAAMDDAALERALAGEAPAAPAKPARVLPDVAQIKRELAKPDMTVALLWDEYRKDHPDGYQYSFFCELVRRELGKLDPVLRREHQAGKEMFTDWAGRTVPIIDADTGEVMLRAPIFVAVLGASSYTFFEAMASQQLPNWIRAHVHAYEFFQGVADLTIPDNTKTGVQQANFYEPEIHPLYLDMAVHYGTAILPTRVRRPRDKALAEIGVQVVQRWVLARLRHRTFFRLEELNRELAPMREWLNDRPFRHIAGSRRLLYEQIDRPALKPLPAERYQWVDWLTAKVGPDYHIQLQCDQRYYSVPFRLIGERVEVRLSPTCVEVLHRGQRVASHARLYAGPRFVTVAEHMPSAHRRYAEWTPERLRCWAAELGPATADLVAGMLERRPHPEQGFRAGMGLIRLAKTYTPERVEAACRRALELGAYSYRSVRSMLQNGLDRAPTARALPLAPGAPHENVRGAAYYEGDD